MDRADPPVDVGLRPLSARSVVLSVLLGSHPPVLPVAALIALADRFGIAAGTVRTAVSRMVAAGELRPTDDGYALAGRLLDRQREQDVGRQGPSSDWDGSWWVATTLTPRRTAADRRTFRSAVEGAKLAELRPETWMRPSNLPVDVRLDGVIVGRGALAADESTALVGRLWDLETLGAHSRTLLRALDDVDRALQRDVPAEADDDAADPIAAGFTVLAACLRHLRVEPQLPTELVGRTDADDLRARYPVVEAALQARLRELFRAALDLG